MLDVATGTGWAARRIAARGASVIGIDLEADLIEAAKAYAAEARLTIDFRVGDAEVLPFDAHSVDAGISTFGVMFVSNPGAAVAELARVGERGGRLRLATWPAGGTVAGLFKIMQPYMRGVEAWSKQAVSTLRLDEKWTSLPEPGPKTKLGGHDRADARPLHIRPR